MTTKTNSKPINSASIRSIESSSWGTGIGRGLKVSRAAEATNTVGIEWPAATVDQVDRIHAAAQQVLTLSAERDRLTLDDLLADDVVARTRAAIAIDEGGQRRATSAQQELGAVAVQGMNRAVLDVAPDMLNTVCDWLIEHQDERHLARAARDLPRHLAGKVSTWNAAVTAHSELLRLTDPMGFEDAERNEGAHRLYSWTIPQWIAFHTEQDTLSEIKTTTPNYWDWKGLEEVELNPARTVAELTKRTKAANDAGQAYNVAHRPTKRAW